MEETSIMQDRKFFDWQEMGDQQFCGMISTRQNQDPTAWPKVAQRLRYVRAAFSLDQKSDLADIIPIDRSSYTKIEKGEKALKPEWAYRIWELYGVPMEYIYRGAMDNIPDKLRIAIMQNLTPRD